MYIYIYTYIYNANTTFILSQGSAMSMPDGTVPSASCAWFWLVGCKSKAFDATVPSWMELQDVRLLEQRLAELNVSEWHDIGTGALGLICIQVGRFVDRALLELDLRPIERVVARYWEHHGVIWSSDFADFLCLPVVRFISFEQMQPSMFAQAPRRSFEALDEGVPELYGSQPEALAQATMLRQSGLDSSPSIALCMPSQFALLLMNGVMDRVILPWPSSRRSRLFKAARVHPSAESMLVPQQRPTTGQPPAQDDFDPSEKLDFAVMAKCLRSIVNKNDVSLPASDRILYTKVIAQLEKMNTAALRREDVIEVNRNRWQYQMVHLLKSVFLSLEMKDVFDFQALAMRCLEVTMQPQVFEMLKRILNEQEDGVLPGRTQLYAHRLSLDVGWMIAQRELYKHKFAAGDYTTFFGLDKSPQGKLDYLMCQCLRVRNEDLAQVYDQVTSLARDMTDRQLTNKQRIDYVLFCCRALMQHVLTPVVVGSGNSGASACLKAWVWSLFLEGGKAGSAADISSMAALTSDFGEAPLTTFGPVSGYTLFPWMQANVEVPLEPEIAVESAELGQARDAGDGDHVGDSEDQEDEDDAFEFGAMPGLIHHNPDDPLAPLLEIDSDSDCASMCFNFVAGPAACNPPSVPCDDSSNDDWNFDMSGCLHVPGNCFVNTKTTDTAFSSVDVAVVVQ